MRIRKISFIVLLLFFPKEVQALILKLYSEVGIDHAHVKLKDIGVFIKEKQDTMSPFYDEMVLFDLPKKITTYSSQEIYDFLSQKIGVSLNIVGSSVKIVPLYTLILQQEVTEKIKIAFTQNYPDIPVFIMDPLYLQIPKIPKIPAGNLKMRIIVPVGKIGVIKYVRLEIKQDNELIYSSSFPIKMLFHVPARVSKQMIFRAHVLQSSDFLIQVINTFKDPRNYVLQDKEYLHKRSLYNMKKGQILYKNTFI